MLSLGALTQYSHQPLQFIPQIVTQCPQEQPMCGGRGRLAKAPGAAPGLKAVLGSSRLRVLWSHYTHQVLRPSL